jgi:hypothetical protein
MHRYRPLFTLVYSRGIARLNAEQIRLSLCTIRRIGRSCVYGSARLARPAKKNEWPIGMAAFCVIWNRMGSNHSGAIAIRSEWLVQFMRAFPTGAVSRRRE